MPETTSLPVAWERANKENARVASGVQIDDLIQLAVSPHKRMCEIAVANGLVVWPKPDQGRPEKAQSPQ